MAHYDKERYADWARQREEYLLKGYKKKPKLNIKGEFVFLFALAFVVGSVLILI